MTLRIIFTVLAYLLFAAHLSRHDLDLLAVVVLLIPFLLFIKKSWSFNIVRYLLYIAAVSWIIPSIQIVQERITQGEDYARFVIIISVIVVYTILTALMLNSPKIKDKYIKK